MQSHTTRKEKELLAVALEPRCQCSHPRSDHNFEDWAPTASPCLHIELGPDDNFVGAICACKHYQEKAQ